MRRRPSRPNIFRNLKRFGVYGTDWKYILLPTAVMYFLPFIFGLWFYHVPMGFPLGVFTFIVLLASFNFLRASKPECWLTHKVEAVSEKWADVCPPLYGALEARDGVQE